MARVRSADVPRYDTYPAPAPAEAEGVPQDWPYEPKTDEFRTRENQRLNRTAEQIGETLGRVAALGHVARTRLQSVRGEAEQARVGLQQKFEEMGDDARERLEDWREAAGERLEDLRNKAIRGLECGRERAARRVNEARVRAQSYARENPLQVIAGALVAGIVLGIGLRAWRSSDE